MSGCEVTRDVVFRLAREMVMWVREQWCWVATTECGSERLSRVGSRMWRLRYRRIDRTEMVRLYCLTVSWHRLL
jgi:hypothetical protein